MYYNVLIICPDTTGGGEEYRSQQLVAYLSDRGINVLLFTKSGLFTVKNGELKRKSILLLPFLVMGRVILGFKRWSIIPVFILGKLALKSFYSVANEYQGKRWLDYFLRKMVVVSVSDKVYKSKLVIKLGNNKYSQTCVNWDRNSAVKILWIGKDNYHKGYSRLKSIVTNLIDVEFVICGLFSEAEENWLLSRDNVRYLGWVDSIYSIASESLIYLQTSNQEGFPNVLVECRQLGLPIIATDVGATSDILLESDILLCKEISDEDLMNKLNLGMSQYFEMRMNSERMIQDAKEQFDENTMKEKYLELCLR